MRLPLPAHAARPAILLLAVLALLAGPAAAKPRGPKPQTHPGGQGAIAFVSDRSGNPDIYRMDVDGSGVTPLTNDPAIDGEPAWSASGTRLAFVSDRDGNQEIYRMTATGTGITKVTNTGFDVVNQNPTWAPRDNRVIFASNRSGNYDLWYQRIDDQGNLLGDPVQLTDSPAFDFQPSVSPDGKTIAFASNRRSPNNNPLGHFEIFVMQANGPEGPNNKPQQLTKNGNSNQNPDWKPNGKQIAFSSDRDNPGSGILAIYVMTSDGQNEQPVSPVGNNGSAPSWSPDGKRLAFTGGDFTDDILRINANGRQLVNLTGESPGGGDSPAWQPR